MPVTNINLINKLIFNYKNNSLPNSLIFSGPKGIGKATSAFFFINKILNLYSSLNNNQNLIYNNTHPNVKLLTKSIPLLKTQLSTESTYVKDKQSSIPSGPGSDV